MNMFNADIAVMSTTIGAPSPEALEAGAPAGVELGIITGLTLPIADPQTGQAVSIPAGKFRFMFGREDAIEVFRAALEAAEALPETVVPSGKVMVAQSMADVDRAAENMKRVTG